MVLICSAHYGSWIQDCEESLAVTFLQSDAVLFSLNFPICQICLQKQCDFDSRGIKGAMERRLLGSFILLRAALELECLPSNSTC